jgi:pimeloyl-ACP methyl ester carboxylesterase
MPQTAASPRTVAFIHGAFVTKHCWDRWLPRYEARGYRCVALAYPHRDRPVAELRAEPDDPKVGTLTFPEVVEHLAGELAALDDKPIVIGHSLGGLLTQLMVQRHLTAAAVAIDSVPPFGVLGTQLSFLRSTWPVLTPLKSIDEPYMMSLDHFRYSFANNLPPAEQEAAWEAEVVPESRRVGRGALSPASRIDFARERSSLLMIGGGQDHIMPAALNRTNFRRYRRSPSVTEYHEFPDHAHYSVIGGPGWEEVADYSLDWAQRQLAARHETDRLRAAG